MYNMFLYKMRCILVMCQIQDVLPRTIAVQLRSKRVDFVCNLIQATLAQDHFVPQTFDRLHTFLLPPHCRRYFLLKIQTNIIFTRRKLLTCHLTLRVDTVHLFFGYMQLIFKIHNILLIIFQYKYKISPVNRYQVLCNLNTTNKNGVIRKIWIFENHVIRKILIK